MSPKAKKLPDQRDSVSEADLDHEGGLYRHKKRPEWGVAILAWEKEERRAYQFEDGRLRKFKKGYYSLLEPADAKDRPTEAVVSSLEEAIEISRGKAPPEPLEPVASFEEQVELFKEMYPEGFQDEKWIEAHRGDPDGRALKRHREAAVKQTQEELSEERMKELVEADRHDEIWKSVTDILGGTSLVALKHVKTLRALEGDERRDFAESVHHLLHGEPHFEPRFKRYLKHLEEVYDGAPSWRIATALPGLMFPQDHVCVRRSAFIRQAASIAPVARYSKRAKLRPYKNYRRVAFAVRKRLEGMDLKPRDLLDIHDFVWDTLRNAALDHYGES